MSSLLYPVVLICLAGVQEAECVPQTALTVIRDIEPTALPQMCIVYAEAALARTALAPKLDEVPQRYVKVLCERGQ